MGKKGKKKKGEKIPENKMPAVDQAFCELTIKDLNNKLSHLRTHNQTLEESNEELRNEMCHIQVDRTDVMAFMDRQLAIDKSDIKDLEEKLLEMENVRNDQTKAFQHEINELNTKFITKEKELSAELRLLNGKLESLEKFRMEKEDITEKFQQLEDELEQSKNHHKEVLFEIERQDIIRKDRLKKDVEQRLLQLSNEFAKSNEIRIATHVQRLVRENIALNNELDRMQFTQRRIQKEMVDIKEKAFDQKKLSDIIEKENKKLIRKSDQQLIIINKLTNECERLQGNNYDLVEAKRRAKVATDQEVRMIQEQHVFKEKLAILEQERHSRESYCVEHIASLKQHNAEVQRLLDIINKIRMSIQLYLDSERLLQEDTCDHRSFREHTRSNLLNHLLRILLSVDDGPVLKPSMETIPSIRELYTTGDFGLIEEKSFKFTVIKPVMSILQFSALKREEEQLQRVNENMEHIEPVCRANEGLLVVDLESASQLISESDSSEEVNDEEINDEEGSDGASLSD